MNIHYKYSIMNIHNLSPVPQNELYQRNLEKKIWVGGFTLCYTVVRWSIDNKTSYVNLKS